MADYYPLIVRAVSGLEKNTGEGRRALYERARSALVAQLRGVIPPLGETEITRERLALEEAIRKVEAEAARRARPEGPATPPLRPSRETPRQPSAALPEPAPPPPSPRPSPPRGTERAPIEPRPAWRRPGAPQYPTPSAADKAAPQLPAAPDKFAFAPPKSSGAPAEPRAPAGAARSSISAEGLKGFRDSVGTTAGLGDAAAAPPPKKPPDAAAPAAHDFDQLQNLDTDSLRAVLRNTEPRLEPPASPEMADLRAAARSRAQRAVEDIPMPEEPPRLRRSYGSLITALIALGLAGGIAALTYWKRDTIGAFYQALRGPPSQAARDASPTRPKIADRIGPATQPAQPRAGSVPAVAQRVVLYEEEQNDPQGRRYIGSAIWRTETVSPGPGQAPDLAIRADVEIPERQVTMTFSLRRNSDQTLPASHTIEIMFNLPADFAGGGISNVPGVLMKQAEQTRGVPLAGLAVKVTTNFFLIGLSAVEADRQRNIGLLKERAWFDIPIVYNNNRRAILAIEKGTPGERAFAEAFAAWRQ